MKEKFNGNKPVILVIDDELGPRESIRIVFKNKYNVLTAASGDEGIEILKTKKVDIIILDLKMPKKNGIDVLAEIRKYNKIVPVIILTGYGDMETAKKAMKYGIIEFITKPFEIPELEKIVAKGIEKGKMKLEIEKLKDEINLLKIKLSQKKEEIKNLTYTGKISEEMSQKAKNISDTIQNYILFLMEELENFEFQENSFKYIDKIKDEINKCADIIEKILEIAEEEIKLEVININEVIKNIVDFLKNSKICQEIEISLNIAETPLKIKSNFFHIQHTFLNLLLDRIKKLQSGEKILIETYKIQNAVVIKINDTGKTEDKIEINPLFLEAIKKYGGNIEIKNTPEKENELIITFPLS